MLPSSAQGVLQCNNVNSYCTDTNCMFTVKVISGVENSAKFAVFDFKTLS